MEFFEYIDFYDIVFTGSLAFVLTVIIVIIRNVIMPGFFLFKNDGEMFYMKHNGIDTDETIEKCKALFPIENFYFRGSVFKRGMNVKVITSGEKGKSSVIKGRFMGKNDFDTICILTENKMIICFIEAISDMAEENII